jgi:hypothetical protein
MAERQYPFRWHFDSTSLKRHVPRGQLDFAIYQIPFLETAFKYPAVANKRVQTLTMHGDNMPSNVPEDENALMRRSATADGLTAAGFPIKTATLATLAVRGGGPPFRKFGRIPLYRWGDSLAWAHSRLSTLRVSTCEGDAQSGAAA